MSNIKNGFFAGALTGASCTVVMGSGVVPGTIVGGTIGVALAALGILASDENSND